jgi:hypothetical protein
MIGPQNLNLVRSVPTITAGAYGAADQVGGVNQLSCVSSGPGKKAKLVSLAISDGAKQDAVLNIFLFREAPTMTGVDNDAFALADGEMKKCVGHVAVAAANYADAAASSVATLRNLDTVVDTLAGHLFYVICCTATPTYAATNDLQLTFGFESE